MQIPSAFELFNDITGMSLNTKVSEEEFLQQIQEYEKEQLAYQLDSQRKEFAFDYMFNRQQQDSDESDSDDDDDNDEDLEEEDWVEGDQDGGEEVDQREADRIK